MTEKGRRIYYVTDYSVCIISSQNYRNRSYRIRTLYCRRSRCSCSFSKEK